MEFFTKREQIAILSIVILILGVFGIKLLSQENESEIVGMKSIEDLEIVEEKDTTLELKPQLIMVHISGQVYNPGIYELIEGDRIVDVVDLAGGLTKEADLDRINLAKKLNDEDKIYIPLVEEDVLFESETLQSTNNNGKTNINNCSKQELEKLPGIGEVIAGRVIEYRENNRFKNIEEITNVSGIGDTKYNQIKDLITVN